MVVFSYFTVINSCCEERAQTIELHASLSIEIQHYQKKYGHPIASEGSFFYLFIVCGRNDDKDKMLARRR